MTDERLPPADLDAERALLGACMHGQRALDTAVEILDPRDFYRPAHAELFAAMVAMRDTGREVDPVTLAAHLGDRLAKLGGHPHLIDLYGAPPTAANTAHYAEIISDAAVRRRLLEAGQRAIQLAHTASDDPAENVERARAALDDVAAQARGEAQAVEIDDLAGRALLRYQNPAPRGVSTGWPDMDEILSGGYRPGHLTVVGARPAVGKSLVACCTAAAVALDGHGVLVVSLEMTEAELTDRILANLASVDLGRLTRHELTERDWQAVEHAADRLRGLPLAVVDHPHLGLTGIRSLARDRARSPRGLSLLVVDYLGLVRPADPRLPRQEQVAGISRGLKLLAKELEVHVLALHQLNRQSEMRANRRPVLADLRESGAIEADADAVWLLHRDDADETSRYELEVLVAKNRHGRTGNVGLAWNPQYARAGSLARLEAV
ncbi:replicative DNA helicase [Pseudonocardia asaccharolytica]|uniref:DNA 5'-3' helicase n=1 Tax=Pseudonocardia asaccharolytica DSM 44247 = NBRC 16224 TaxID=1123024 RepID=A0A511D6S6_9PSEU|nr:replicative DNA helicase [Pseudonocardia asaccharolytica]GEL19314.1 replicative DNA helicase [Pseudonocardia asaccharolytica DSM 44247 = NBRC 16224]